MELFGTLCIFLLLHISQSTAHIHHGLESVNPGVVLPFTLQNGEEVDVSFTQDKFDDFLGYICHKEAELCKVKLGYNLAVKKIDIDYGAPSNIKTWCTVAVRDFWAHIWGYDYSRLEMRRCQHDDYWSRVNERCETISRNDNGCNSAEVSVPLGASRRLKVADDAQICTVCKRGDDCYNSGVTSPDVTDGGIGVEVVSSTTTLPPPETVTTAKVTERTTRSIIRSTSTSQDRTTESTTPINPINAASREEDVQIPIILGAALAGGILILVIIIFIVGVILWRRMGPREDQRYPAVDLSNQGAHENGIYFVNPKKEMLKAEYQGPHGNGLQFVNLKNEKLEAENEYSSFPTSC